MRSEDGNIQVYTTAENRRWLEKRAENLGCSISEYVHELIQKHVDILRDHHEYSYDESEGLDTLVDEVYDETDILLREFWGETAAESGVMHEPGRLHLVVLWRLLAGEYSIVEQEYAMQLTQNYIGDHTETVPKISPSGGRWRDSDEELLAADFMTSDTGSETAQPTDELDTDTSTDEGLSPVDFMTGATGGDTDG